MSGCRYAILASLLAVSVGLLTACGKKETPDHDHGAEKSEAKGEGHEHEESPSGASFKPGKGVMFTDETRKILGVEVAEVVEEKLPRMVRFSAQVYRDSSSGDETATLKASGTVSRDKAAFLHAGQRAMLSTQSGASVEATIEEVHPSLTTGETEVDLVFKLVDGINAGDFPTAIIMAPRAESVPVVPRTALLRTSEGTFIYTVNGDAFYRTAVKVGAENEASIEIVDGLLAGDSVVTKPVETLWLIELRATKGGGHSH